MKNRLIDLNNHLFAQLELLGDVSVTGKRLEEEVIRTDAMVKVSEQIIENASLVLRGAALVAEHGTKIMLPMLDSTKGLIEETKK